MFNRTTLYLDASSSVADQCIALCEELESTRTSQMIRVHFTPSVFRAFAEYALMRAGGSRLPRGFNRVYWMVIGGEALDVRDLELATVIFPGATIACNYAVSFFSRFHSTLILNTCAVLRGWFCRHFANVGLPHRPHPVHDFIRAHARLYGPRPS